MTIEELKQAIEERTGIPALFLTGETAEENIARAKAILAYKKRMEDKRPKTVQEEFEEWFNDISGQRKQDPKEAALADLEATVQREASAYPILKDGQADTSNMPDPRPVREQFAEWMEQNAAFNPFRNPDI